MLEVLEYLFAKLKDKQPVTHTVDGQPYAVKENGELGQAVLKLAPQFTKPVLNLSSLSGLVTAYQKGVDGFNPSDSALRVSDYLTVELIELKADDFGRRHVFAKAAHVEPPAFAFGKFYEPEDFLIAFRAGFHFNDMAERVQRLCSSLTAESGVSVSDDGMSQVVTIKEGAITRQAIDLPPEIPLIPWRTFRDANPVESKFLLRMRAIKDKLPQIAIFEIDGKWKLDTIHSIQKYLQKELPEAVVIA